MLIVFEKLVGISLGHKETDTRHIRLRENAPHLSLMLTPSDHELKHSENLERKAYDFSTDAHGFLLPSLIHNNADLTVAFIGGSTTECMYVDADKRFHHLVSQSMSNDTYKVNTINAGVSGNDSLNSINAYLNKVIPIKPDIAILMHLPNSFELLHRIKATLAGPVDEFADDRGKTKAIDQQNIYRQFEENLDVFISISKAKGITPILMTQASRFTDTPDPVVVNRFKDLESLGINYTQFKALFDGMNDRIRTVAEKHQIALIDLAKNIPPHKDYIVDTVHFNDDGSSLVASFITEKLNEIHREKP